MNAKVDQCDQGGQRGSCYTILLWDPGKGSKVTSARHGVHLVNPTALLF
jgi:hypothetical protein